MIQNVQALAQRAQQAMREGRLDEALTILANLRVQLPGDGSIWLMTAYALRSKGEVDKARAAFEEAIRAQPHEISFRGTYAAWLTELGDDPAALAQYDAILALHPGHLDARIDRLLILARSGERASALEQLARVVEANPTATRAANNLAVLLREDDRVEEAEKLARGVLARDPANGRAAHLLAECLHDEGRDPQQALELAARLDPAKLQIAASLAHARIRHGRADEGIALLEDRLATNPDWIEGYHSLADMKWQLGDREGFASHYRSALDRHPHNAMLWFAYAGLIARTKGHEQALEITHEARRHLPEDPSLKQSMADSLSELGRYEEAGDLFAQLDTAGNLSVLKSWMRYLVRAQRFEEAREAGLAASEAGLADQEVWPYTAIALRKLDDPRWEWLEGHPSFIRRFDIRDRMGRLDDLVETLRELHFYKQQPIAQSVRGGTQTSSILFRNASQSIQKLRKALEECVAEYIAGLPAPDTRHPLLGRPRDTFRFSGSWSVRLTGGGFHANHIHSLGDISSAFYVVLPPSVASSDESGDEENGWLVLGEPAAELETGLAPIEKIRPQVGTLALFPSTMWHGTRPFDEGERMTCAFDVKLSSY